MGIIAAGAPSCVAEPERVVAVPFRLLIVGVHLRNGFSVGHHAHAVLGLFGLHWGMNGAWAVRYLRT